DEAEVEDLRVGGENQEGQGRVDPDVAPAVHRYRSDRRMDCTPQVSAPRWARRPLEQKHAVIELAYLFPGKRNRKSGWWIVPDARRGFAVGFHRLVFLAQLLVGHADQA